MGDAVAKGARLRAGGQRDNTIMDATILDHVTPDMRIYAKESFGPVACILLAADTEDAIRLYNDTQVSVWHLRCSAATSRAPTVARRVRSGICHINGPTVHDEAQMPFGGHKGQRLWPLRWLWRYRLLH